MQLNLLPQHLHPIPLGGLRLAPSVSVGVGVDADARNVAGKNGAATPPDYVDLPSGSRERTPKCD
jgi:hypothetical protein